VTLSTHPEKVLELSRKEALRMAALLAWAALHKPNIAIQLLSREENADAFRD